MLSPWIIRTLTLPPLLASLNTAHLSPVSYTHSHSEIYSHATFHCSVYYDTLHHCHIALHDHVVDIVFVAKPPCIIFHTCHSWFIAPSRYTAGGIHIESYLVLVSSYNSYVVINRSVMIIIIRALPNQKNERPKKGKAQKKEKIKKRAMLLSLFPHLCFKVAPCSSCSESHILCFKVAPFSSCSESHKLSFYTSGNFSL